MNKLNCIIIEDQIPAQEILQRYIGQVPDLQLLKTYISPLEAVKELESGAIDILFLDVHLPQISGIELLKSLHRPPLTILTTAFSEYAVLGFELDVVDYLLKPFSFERFLKSISKIQHLLNSNQPTIHQEYLFIRNQQHIQKIAIKEILFVKANGDFTLIHTATNRIIANSSLQNMLTELGNHFIRCHRSYIVNIDAINKISGNRILVNKDEIPIGRTYKELLLEKIKMI